MLVTQPSGSYVCVWITPDIYIDSRKDIRYPNSSFIEEVKHGQVVGRYTVPNEVAPDVITQVMRDYAKRLNLTYRD